MPPNKKKKKAATNPARGFSTVSLPSKSKLDESKSVQADTDLLVPLTAGDTHENVQHTASASNSTSGLPEIKEMTPDELEAHLEDAELQSILDIQGPRCRKDAAWQVTKLENQRRTLRSQAMHLEASAFLSDDIVEKVIQVSKHEQSVNEKFIPTRPVPIDKCVTESDLCLNLWTLQKALEALYFTCTDDAFKYLINLASNYGSDRCAASKDYIWGLEECLDWLAIHSSIEELPTYTRNHNTQHSLLQTEPQMDEASGNLTPESLETLPTTDQEGNPPVGTMQVATDIASYNADDDDDNDPEKLVTKYIEAKLALLEVEQSIHQERNGGSAIFDRQKLLASQVPQLQRKVERIERDILFDKDEAALKWNDVSKAAETRLRESRTWSASQTDTIIGESNLDIEGSTSDSDKSDDDLLGNIFEATSAADIPINNHKGQEDSILIVDFGSWSGMNPRRIFEEACKARDPACHVSFRQISSSSFSNRQSLRINWSSNQHTTSLPLATLSRLACDARPRGLSIAMQSISTPTALQAESYVSTVALFAVFSGSAREEKVSLRLPPVWRDLWKDFAEQRKTQSDSSEKACLAHIRSLINKNFSCPKPNSDHLVREQHAQASNELHSTASPAGDPQLPPGHLQAIWTRIASTPAYRRMFQTRSELPIWDHRDQIVRTVANQQVTILCAETGAGKSTQVPSYILQNELICGINSRILITQPRRISAISIAKRVSAELGENKADLGTSRSVVGYAIRLESKISSSTRITYATTGVLLRILETSPDLKDLSCLILDEIHEHSMDLDLLLIAIRRLMVRRPELRIVLMSASLDAQKLSLYFAASPILKIPGRTYPVEVKYLEDAIEATNTEAKLRPSKLPAAQPDDGDGDGDSPFEAETERTGIAADLESYSIITRTILEKYDEYRVDYDLVADLAAVIASDKSYEKYSKAILIFMPGISEIRKLHRIVMSHPKFIQGWVVHLLHSSFSTEDLESAFMPPPPGMKKIVIATNIAETGITIPDITAVIDTCKEKIMRFDERRQLSKLSEAFISRSSTLQRRGRAARVQEGLCFHLVTRYRHERLMAEHPIPEMLRLSLQDAILRVKIWDLGDIEGTLSEALDPPSTKNIRRTIESLKEVKALTASETLTPLGRQLARLPLDIWLGKLAVLGITFRCLDAAITIAATLSAKSPFAVSHQADARANLARFSFSRGDSDPLMMLNAYLAWRSVSRTGDVYEFCRKNYLNPQALSQIEEQKVQLFIALSDAGLLPLNDTEMSSLRRARLSGGRREFFDVPERFNVNHQSDIAINSLIAVGFFPKLLMRHGKGWKNVSTNQDVSLAPTSVNRKAATPPKWLSFYQAMQTKSKNLNVFDTSAVPESAIALLLGDADFKLYSGVITIDGSKIRLSVRDWKTMVALKLLRHKIQGLMTQMFRSPGKLLSPLQQPWFELWQVILTPPHATDEILAK